MELCDYSDLEDKEMADGTKTRPAVKLPSVKTEERVRGDSLHNCL